MAGRLVLFGGTFDPVHFGHLIIARAVAERLGFERITLVPTACPPHKQAAVASPADRMAMLDLATRDDPLFDICGLELGRGGMSYTFDTVQALMDRHGSDCRVCLVIGADMLGSLPAWHRAEELVRTVRIVVAYRPGWQVDAAGATRLLAEQFSTDAARQMRVEFVETMLVDISSSLIRQRVRDQLPIRYLTPVSVVSYIHEHGLYRDSARS